MRPQATLEVLIFLGSTSLGVYAMGQLWYAAFHRGGFDTLLWAALLFLCLFLLGKQIGRMQSHQGSARQGRGK